MRTGLPAAPCPPVVAAAVESVGGPVALHFEVVGRRVVDEEALVLLALHAQAGEVPRGAFSFAWTVGRGL